MHGLVTTDWYLAGFDMAMEGVAYQLMGAAKGSVVRITSVNNSAPPLITPKSDDAAEVSPC